MKITLLIGNGFDINLGLHTRYKDFYNKHYLSLPDSDPNIAMWKKRITADFELWSDLERHLRVVAESLSDQELDDFMDFLDDLTEELSNYLDQQSQRLVFNESPVAAQVASEGLKAIEKHVRTSAFWKMPGPKNKATEYTILNFNYTTSLEKLLRLSWLYADSPVGSFFPRPVVIHPHGDLKYNLVVGTSGVRRTFEEEMEGDSVKRENLRRWLVKENVLQQDQRLRKRLERASVAIQESDAICVYGMSLGESDVLWWRKLATWLMQDRGRRLIVFSHSVTKGQNSRVPRRQFVNKGEPIKEQFLSYCNNMYMDGTYSNAIEIERLRDQIVVLPDADIFNYHVQEETITDKQLEEILFGTTPVK